jgi:DNA polymerase
VTAAADIAAAKSLLAFWAEAGVDTAMSDTPIDRMAEGRKRLQPARTPAAPRPVAAPVAPAAKAPGPDVVAAAAEARALAAAAGDLDALKAAIANFEGCALRFSGATQAVFARGNPNAPVMVIGEGPGADEDRQGAPFVGRAGQLLDKMLAAAGLTDQVFITNSVFWRPPGNRTPSPQEQAACAPFVERAIALVKPKALLLSGGASAKFMLKRAEGILSLRGRRFDWTSEDGSLTVPALPTLHPAFLLRQPAAKKHAWADLLALRRLLSESN